VSELEKCESVSSVKPAGGDLETRALLLFVFFSLMIISMPIVTDAAITFHVGYYRSPRSPWIVMVLISALAPIFILPRFCFGYFTGFYLFAMMAEYFWFNTYGILGYDRGLALLSEVASILLFLAAALLIKGPVKQFFVLPQIALDLLPVVVLFLALVVLAMASMAEFHLVGFSEMNQYRSMLTHSRLVLYFVGMFQGALFPFSFACLWMRRRWYLLTALCVVSMLFYPAMLNKTAILTAPFLIFVGILARRFEARAVVVLSLLIPLTIGLIAYAVASEFSDKLFGVLNIRLLAVPAIALDHYLAFFSDHPLTYFCQVGLTKGTLNCPYPAQLGVVLANWFGLGNLNASFFATEGVASVGPRFAPIVAFGCGLIIAAGNTASAGLPQRFVLLSSAAMPNILVNVPMTTTLLSHGLGLLILLWYITPRHYFHPGDAVT
jgi:hypothetical protein